MNWEHEATAIHHKYVDPPWGQHWQTLGAPIYEMLARMSCSGSLDWHLSIALVLRNLVV